MIMQAKHWPLTGLAALNFFDKSVLIRGVLYPTPLQQTSWAVKCSAERS